MDDSLKLKDLLVNLQQQNYMGYLDQLGHMLLDYAPKALLGFLLVYVGFRVVNRIMGFMDNLMQNRHFDADLRPFLRTLGSILLKMMLLLSAAEVMGVQTTSFVALLAAAGFAVGLALQGSLSNFAGGILILIFKPFKTGDLITAQEYTGIVREIQIFNTILVTLNNRRIIIPNGVLSNGVIENVTGAGIIRVEIKAGVSYSDSIDKVRAVAHRVIRDCPFAYHEEPEKYVHRVSVQDMADSSVDFVIHVWAKGQHFWDCQFYMKEHLKKAFDAHDINIPFPQMDVYVKEFQHQKPKKNQEPSLDFEEDL